MKKQIIFTGALVLASADNRRGMAESAGGWTMVTDVFTLLLTDNTVCDPPATYNTCIKPPSSRLDTHSNGYPRRTSADGQL